MKPSIPPEIALPIACIHANLNQTGAGEKIGRSNVDAGDMKARPVLR